MTSLCLLCNLLSLSLISLYSMHSPHCVLFLQLCLCWRKSQIKPLRSIFAQDASGPQGVFVPVCGCVCVLGGDGRPDGAAVSLSQQA